jgi:hypothetical protein
MLKHPGHLSIGMAIMLVHQAKINAQLNKSAEYRFSATH